MDDAQPVGRRRRTIAIIAAAGLACLAIAIPVSGAFGADESGNTGGAAQQQQGYGPPADGQGKPPSGAPRGDCPKGEGGAPQGQPPQGGGSSGSDSSGYALPGDTVPL